MNVKKKIFILTRYSILSKDAARSWKIGQKSEDEYREKLFDKGRLELHQKIFETLTLPSVLNSKSNSKLDIQHLIFISTELPTPHKQAIYKTVSNHSFSSIFEIEPSEKTIPFIENKVGEALAKDEGETIYATVRLDDDDALHPSFLSRLERYINNNYIDMGVSFSRGYSGIYDGEKFSSFHEMNSINNAQGQAFISKYDHSKTPTTVYGLKVAHSRLHWVAPVIADGLEHMYIRTVHQHGDFYSKDYEKKMSSSSSIDKKHVLSSFGLSVDKFI